MTDTVIHPRPEVVWDAEPLPGGIEGGSLDVTVVLPCLNEEDSVGACVHEALDAIALAGWTGEVVVVDNGSSDDSAAAAAAAGARVVTEKARGYGAALLMGIGSARGRVVVMADADCTYPLDRLAEIVTLVMSGEVDVAIGSRLDGATRRSMPILHRLVGTPLLTWLVRKGTGVTGLSDSQSGFRAFTRGLAEELDLKCSGMEFASEMLIRAAQHNITVREIPMGYRERVGESKLSAWRDGIRHLRLISRLSPQLLLWIPGLVGVALGMLTFLLAIIQPYGASIGSLTWQPIFFGTILLVVGTVSALSGALLARHSPAASSSTRAAFAWVSDRRVVRWIQRVGVVMALTGLVLDGYLFDQWVSGARLSPNDKLHLASIAQGLLLDGVILIAVLGIYRILLTERILVDQGDRSMDVTPSPRA